MAEPVKAEGLFWLIVGVFWVIAQIVGTAAKKNQPRPPLSDTGDERDTPEDPMAELLRKLTGERELRPEPPELFEDAKEEHPWRPGDIEPLVPARNNPPQPVAAARSRMTKVNVDALPDIKPLRRADIPEPVAKSATTPVVDVRPKMSTFRQSVPVIKLPAMNLSFRGAETAVQGSPNLAKILNPSDRNSIRRAMLGHIILGKPKGLEGCHTGTMN